MHVYKNVHHLTDSSFLHSNIYLNVHRNVHINVHLHCFTNIYHTYLNLTRYIFLATIKTRYDVEYGVSLLFQVGGGVVQEKAK